MQHPDAFELLRLDLFQVRVGVGGLEVSEILVSHQEDHLVRTAANRAVECTDELDVVLLEDRKDLFLYDAGILGAVPGLDVRRVEAEDPWLGLVMGGEEASYSYGYRGDNKGDDSGSA